MRYLSFLVILSIFVTSFVFAEVDGTYQRIYDDAAIIRVTPQLTVPNKLTINLSGGFSFSRRLIVELIVGAGSDNYISNGYYFATRMVYKLMLDRKSYPGINLIVGANNRNQIGFDMGFSFSKYFRNFSVYLGLINKNVFGFNTGTSLLYLIPGVEIPISRQIFFNMESGWDINGSGMFVSSGISIAIY